MAALLTETSLNMPSDLSSYLATHYLTADTTNKPSSKKRKRKHDKTSGGGLLIQDDDDWGGGSSVSRKSKHRNDDDDGDLPVTVGTVRDARKPTTKANWKTVGGSNDESAAADAILASAAAEAAAARAADEADDPTFVEGEDQPTTTTTKKMADGSYAGLQSASAVTAQLERRQREEREQFEAERRAGLVADQEETYYRDATGRRVDVGMARAAARRAALDVEEKEKAKKEALRGEVQVEEAKQRRGELERARGMGVARGGDDEDMNRELKGQRRWNDPMARFLEAEEESPGAAKADGGGKGGGTTGKKASSRRPLCKHPAPPNRYGIRPGYRWDGVDRSNGFEAQRFKALNRRERNKGLDYAWQMDE